MSAHTDTIFHHHEGGVVSDPDTTMDQMIQRASVPNLATLFRQGKQAGLIPTDGVTVYAGGPPV